MLGPWLALSEEHGIRTPTGSPTEWLRNFGHDTYAYPLWVQDQQLACECKPLPDSTTATCHSAGTVVDWREAVRTSPLGAEALASVCGVLGVDTAAFLSCLTCVEARGGGRDASAQPIFTKRLSAERAAKVSAHI